MIYDTIIIGGGVAGYSAAMYGGRLGMKCLVIVKEPGGALALTDIVENYPGFKRIGGMELAQKIEEHAKEYNPKIVTREANDVHIAKENEQTMFHVTAGGEEYFGRTVIFATGTRVRKLDVPGEAAYAGRGVSYCALCDGALFRGKALGVVGGSDSAVKDALVLAEYASRVYIIYRREKVRAEPANLKRLETSGKIEVINNTNVIEIEGDGKLITHVVLDKEYNGSSELVLGGLFIDVGHVPLSGLAKNIGVATNKKEEIIINRNSETNIPGAFACGDVADTKFKQAITGVAEAVLAVYSAYEYVGFAKVSPENNGV